MIPIQGLNEIKAHKREVDAVYRGVNEETERDVQRKDHSKHSMGIIDVYSRYVVG